jgi:hypothetical protein
MAPVDGYTHRPMIRVQVAQEHASRNDLIVEYRLRVIAGIDLAKFVVARPQHRRDLLRRGIGDKRIETNGLGSGWPASHACRMAGFRLVSASLSPSSHSAPGRWRNRSSVDCETSLASMDPLTEPAKLTSAAMRL